MFLGQFLLARFDHRFLFGVVTEQLTAEPGQFRNRHCGIGGHRHIDGLQRLIVVGPRMNQHVVHRDSDNLDCA
jgi:hypothetical protein